MAQTPGLPNDPNSWNWLRTLPVVQLVFALLAGVVVVALLLIAYLVVFDPKANSAAIPTLSGLITAVFAVIGVLKGAIER